MGINKLKQMLEIMNIDCELVFENEIYKITLDGSSWWEVINEKNYVYRFREIAYRAGYFSDPICEGIILLGKNGITTKLDLNEDKPTRFDIFCDQAFENEKGYKE